MARAKPKRQSEFDKMNTALDQAEFALEVLRKKAEEYTARRLGQGEPPSAEVFQLWQEIAAKPKDDDVV